MSLYPRSCRNMMATWLLQTITNTQEAFKITSFMEGDGSYRKETLRTLEYHAQML